MALVQTRPLAAHPRADDWRDVAAVPRHRSRPLLPGRHHRPRDRADRDRQGRVPAVRGPGPVPRVRPRHQPGLRRVGRHLRGGAPQAAQAARRPPAPHRLIPAHLARPRPPARRGSSRVVHGSPGPPRATGTSSRTTVPGRGRRRRSPRSSAIVPVELGGHQRAHDRQAEPARRRRGRTRRGGRRRRRPPTTRSVVPVVGQADHHPTRLARAGRAPGGKAWSTAFCSSSLSTTASGVATVAGRMPASPSTVKLHGVVRRGQPLLDHADERPHDLDEGDVVAGLPGQRLVDERDGADAPHRLLDGRLRLGRARAAGPAGAAATRSSAGCSSPGGGSRGWWRPWRAAGGRGGGARRCRG